MLRFESVVAGDVSSTEVVFVFVETIEVECTIVDVFADATRLAVDLERDKSELEVASMTAVN